MSVLDFTDIRGLNDWFDRFRTTVPLYNVNTFSYSTGRDVPDLLPYVAEMSGLDTEKEKNACYGRAVVEATKSLAPIKEFAWSASNLVTRKSLAWFEANKTTAAFKLWDDDYNNLKGRLPTVEQIENYHLCAKLWRKDTGFEMNPLTSTLRGGVVTRYAVSQRNVDTVKLMLDDMLAKRKARIEGGGGTVRAGGTQPDHINWTKKWLQDGQQLLMCPSWGSWAKSNKQNQLLGGTAFANLEQTTDLNAVAMAEANLEQLKMIASSPDNCMQRGLSQMAVTKMVADIDACIVAAKGLIQSSREASPASKYHQQVAAMDVPFSAHYWLWKIGGSLPLLPVVSQWLFELGQRPSGAKKVSAMLHSMPYLWAQKMLGLFAADQFVGNKIYMHPAVLTPGRLGDMTSVFGLFPIADPVRVLEGTGCIRTVLNLKTTGSNPCADTIVSLFKVFSAGFDPKNEEIVPPEHMLHQSFLGKQSPYQTAAEVGGTFAKVEVVPSTITYI
ncbi:nucleoprotein [Bandia virus]|uniref:Nucleoprotein n=1 Tax=Bandia virus TaxID=248060 RepID=A0A191KW86_9VIRU|nr:nucleoprotein [Bandia virus]